jgi:hypothetical protein
VDGVEVDRVEVDGVEVDGVEVGGVLWGGTSLMRPAERARVNVVRRGDEQQATDTADRPS